MEHWHVVNDDGCPVGSGQWAAGRVVGTVVAKGRVVSGAVPQLPPGEDSSIPLRICLNLLLRLEDSLVGCKNCDRHSSTIGHVASILARLISSSRRRHADETLHVPYCNFTHLLDSRARK